VRAGIPLAIAFNISRIAAKACTPLAGAMVDLWHCDALGVYSDVRDPGFNTQGEKWLRGYQVTDSRGVAQFTTIYPGWYRGRTVHIHFKVRSPAGVSPAYEFTSQLYFDDGLTDKVHAQTPYATKGQRDMRNSADGIYRRDGSQLIMALTPNGDGYQGVFDVSLQTG
jgi:protocatechuate 3,4-dioxygenase beta subunit